MAIEPCNRLWARLALGLGGIALLAGCGALGLWIDQRMPGLQLRAAEARWAARPFVGYRMVIEGDEGRCRQEVAVRGERIVQNVENTCRVPTRSVTSLFKLIESISPATYRCVDYGCACDTVVTVHTRFDPQWGYPREIAFRWEVRANLLHRDYWAYFWSEGRFPSCRTTRFSRTITVHSLTPMP